MNSGALVLITATAVIATAQTPATVQRTAGSCSPAVITGGNVTITCNNLADQQVELLKRIPQLVQQLMTRSRTDADAILTKLDEILSLQRAAQAERAERTLDDETAAELTAMARLTRMDCSVGASINDREAGNYAKQLGDSLRQGGWTVTLAMLPPLDHRGLQLIVSPREETRAVDRIAATLRATGASVTIRTFDGLRIGDCQVAVGAK
jgi:hypothetical protein